MLIDRFGRLLFIFVLNLELGFITKNVLIFTLLIDMLCCILLWFRKSLGIRKKGISFGQAILLCRLGFRSYKSHYDVHC